MSMIFAKTFSFSFVVAVTTRCGIMFSVLKICFSGFKSERKLYEESICCGMRTMGNFHRLVS